MPFSLLWKDSENKEMAIPKGRTANLGIATYDDKGAMGLTDSWSSMRFDGLDEFAIWGKTSQESPLPAYVMKISIFSKRAKEPYTVHFEVGPEKFDGPLRMVECKISGKEVIG
jgi:hypothetical protein